MSHSDVHTEQHGGAPDGAPQRSFFDRLTRALDRTLDWVRREGLLKP